MISTNCSVQTGFQQDVLFLLLVYGYYRTRVAIPDSIVMNNKIFLQFRISKSTIASAVDAETYNNCKYFIKNT